MSDQISSVLTLLTRFLLGVVLLLALPLFVIAMLVGWILDLLSKGWWKIWGD